MARRAAKVIANEIMLKYLVGDVTNLGLGAYKTSELESAIADQLHLAYQMGYGTAICHTRRAIDEIEHKFINPAPTPKKDEQC